METGNALAILRRFDEQRPVPSAAGAIQNTRWRWKAGVIRFPDSYCPWCGVAMRSTAIWLTSEVPARLYGQVRIVDGRLTKAAPRHPHVNGVEVCTRGDKSDGTNRVYQALFLAYNFDSMYWTGIDPRKHLKDGGGAAHRYYVDAQQWRSWLTDYFAHTCGTTTVAERGLSAELKRSDAVATKAEPAVALAANEVAAVVPAVDDAPIFARPNTVVSIPPQPPTLDELPIFGRSAAGRNRRLNRSTERGLFDGSLAGGGITAD